LQKAKEIPTNYKMKAVDMEHLVNEFGESMDHTAVRLGDTNFAIDNEYNPVMQFTVRVIKVKNYLGEPERRELEHGNFLPLFTNDSEFERIKTKLNDQSGVWNDATIVTDGSFLDTIPQVPTNFTADGLFAKVALDWDYNPTSLIAAYELYASTIQTFTPDSSNLVFRGKSGGFSFHGVVNTTYYFRLRAINPAGTAGGYTAEVSATAERIITDDILFGAITNEKLADLAITATKLANGSVTNDKILNDAITALKIATGAITEVKIAPNAVTVTKILDGAIANDKIAASTITGAKIAANTITATQIAALTITANEIAAGAITATKIVTNSITATQIAASTITAAQMVAGTITAASGIIGTAAITTANIANLAVGNAAIANLAVTNAKIGLLAVGEAQIADLTVTNAKIGNLAVDAAKIADLAVTNAKIANATITSAKIVSLNADKIVATSLSAISADLGTVTAGTLNGVYIYSEGTQDGLPNIADITGGVFRTYQTGYGAEGFATTTKNGRLETELYRVNGALGEKGVYGYDGISLYDNVLGSLKIGTFVSKGAYYYFGIVAENNFDFTMAVGKVTLKDALQVEGKASFNGAEGVTIGSSLRVGTAATIMGLTTLNGGTVVKGLIDTNDDIYVGGSVAIGTTSPASGRALHIVSNSFQPVLIEANSTSVSPTIGVVNLSSPNTVKGFRFEYNYADGIRIQGTNNTGGWVNTVATFNFNTPALNVTGDFSVSGTKAALVETENYGKRLMYALETPDNRFVAYTEHLLEEGEHWITIEPMFLETISNYFIVPHVQNASDVIVLERREGKFRVWVQGHKAEVVFEINGMRKGHEDKYMEIVPETKKEDYEIAS